MADDSANKRQKRAETTGTITPPNKWLHDKSPNPNLPPIHCPEFSLPPFNGEALQFKAFITNFRTFIHRNPQLTFIDKINYIQASLTRNIRTYVEQFPLSPERYYQRLDYLYEKYAHQGKVQQELWVKIASIKPQDSSSTSLRRAYEQLMLFRKYADGYDTLVNQQYLFTQICNNFLRYLYKHRITADASVEQLLDVIHQAIRFREYYTPRSLTFQSTTPTKTNNTYNRRFPSQRAKKQTVFFTPSTTGAKKTNNSTKSKNAQTQTEKIASFTDLPPFDTIPTTCYKIPFMPTHNLCVFCRGKHWSFVCYNTSYNTLEKRKKFFSDNICPLCHKEAHEGCKFLDTYQCRWPNCRNRSAHNSTLCPMAPYPLTLDTYKAWKQVVLELIEKSKSKNTGRQGNSTSTPQRGKPFDSKTFNSNEMFQDKSGNQEEPKEHRHLSQNHSKNDTQQEKESTIPKDSEYTKNIFLTSSIDNNFLLFTAKISASPYTPPYHYIRGFFDSGSPKSYIQIDKAINEIHLSPHRQDTICIQGVGDQRSAPQISQEVIFYLHTNSSSPLRISAAILPVMTPHTFPFEIDQIKSRVPKLNTLQYADSQPHLPITLLLGKSHMWPFIESIEVLHENVFLINTSIGFMIAGEGIKTLIQPTPKLHTSFHSTPQNLWDLEAIGINTKGLAETEAELKALQRFYA